MRIQEEKITKFDWVNYFSSKRSDYLNAIIGVWIGFVFGFVTLLSTAPSSTVLDFIAFFLVTIFIALYFFQKFRFYDEWEQHALIKENEINGVEFQRNCKKLLNPESKRTVHPFFYLLTPKSIAELFLQCSVWGAFVIVSLLWKNNTLIQIQKCLPPFRWEPENTLLEFGPRHIIFIIPLFISIIIIMKNLYFYKMDSSTI